MKKIKYLYQLVAILIFPSILFVISKMRLVTMLLSMPSADGGGGVM